MIDFVFVHLSQFRLIVTLLVRLYLALVAFVVQDVLVTPHWRDCASFVAVVKQIIDLIQK